MVVVFSSRRRQRETRENVRERRVKTLIIHNRQRERRRGKRTNSGDSEEDKQEDEGTKGRRTSDDVHDVSDDREGDDALAIEYLNFWGKRQSIFRYKNKARTLESRRVVIACLTARSTTRLRLRTTRVAFGSGMNIFGANSVRERPQSVSSFQDINASSTLDESISKTFKRDIDRIVSNVKNVLDAKRVFLGNRNSNGEENSQQQQPLRDWDLYGPLIFVLLFGVCLSSSAGGSSSKTKSDAGTIFSVVFATVAFGAFALTLNVKFLGGKIIFLQAMSLIGYCIFLGRLSALLCWVSHQLLVSVLRGRVRRDVVVRSVRAVRECSRRRGEESVSRVSNGAVVRDFRSVRRRRSLIYKIFFILLYCSFPLSFFSPITCEKYIRFYVNLSSKIYHPTARARKRESARTMSDDESAEKADDRGERFFVGCDREERRYLFRTHSSEIESN